MHAETIDLSFDAGLQAVFQDDVATDRVGIERLLQLLGGVVGHRAEHGAGGISAVGGERQEFLDESLRHRMHRNEPDFTTLAPDPKVRHAPAALDVHDPQAWARLP